MAKRNPAELFTALATEFNRYIHEKKSQVERDILCFPAIEGERFGQALFSNLSEGGFCTLLVSGRSAWDPRNHYHQSVRFAAQRGCNITRAFLLPHRLCWHDPVLREHVMLDREAGIKTEILYVGELIASHVFPVADSLEFGIWDNVIGCIGLRGSSGSVDGVAEWRVTSRAEDIQTLQDIERILHDRATPIDPEQNDAPDLEEPMITTARLAEELSTVLCQGNHVSPEDCSWYHSVWQYLRIFNMVSTPTWHTQFYLRALTEARRPAAGGLSILISGTADYSMLAHVLWAYKHATSPPSVTVLDLCETPLFLCKWYGKTVGVRVETAAKDILKFEPSEPFDIVITDAFLTRFSDEERGSVVNKWHDVLRPGGRVITTIRLERGLAHAKVRATPEQASAFRRRAFQEARRWHGFLPRDPEELANLAQRYAERMTSCSLNSEEQIRELFLSHDFEINQMDVVQVPGELASTLYAEIVACRR